ncbi:MAG: PorT family protein [Muribaculaceae bacterium]|nr:PorT family protein [Muribaculaceae bacterium]
MKKIVIVILGALIFGLRDMSATEKTNGVKEFFAGLEYEVNAGTNIGGASPIPLPSEIRKIDSYNPDLNLQIGVSARKWLGDKEKWGVGLGIRLETKGMKTKATVKNYGMEIIDNGKTLKGRWTGKVQTKYHSRQLVIPLTAFYKLNRRIRFNVGPYLSYAFSNDFGGYVSDGYLREGDPTGNKISFGADSKASYDFGEQLRKFQWGMQLGGSVTVYKQLAVNANLEWGCNDIFNSSFKTVSFNLYPIYLNLGFAYIF